MPKKPKARSVVETMWATLRRNPIKTVTAILGLLAAYPTGMAGARLIGEQAEPGWFANRGWVRDIIDEKIKPLTLAQSDDRKILRDIQIDGNNRSKRDEVNNLAKWTVERDKAKDPLTLELIDKQIKASRESIDALDQQLRTLEHLKSQGR